MIADSELFLRGILLGLAVAAPVGPIGVLCIQRSLANGFWAGFSGGIGTAVADAAYAAAAAAGFAVLIGNIGAAGEWLRWGGAAVIAWLGWRTLLAPVASKAAEAPASGSPLRLFLVTFALTISNPATILSFAALFAALGLAENPSWSAAVAAVLGVFIGSLLWWGILSGAVSAMRRRISEDWKLRVNRVAGVVLIAFAVILVV